MEGKQKVRGAAPHWGGLGRFSPFLARPCYTPRVRKLRKISLPNDSYMIPVGVLKRRKPALRAG